MRKYLLFLGALAVLPLLTGCGYNRMVGYEESVTAQWANVENAYQRRADLIPNLVNTVKGYAEHEKSTLQAVVEARSNALSVKVDPSNLSAADIQKFQAEQSKFSSAISRLLVLVENYPDLKANQNFLDLQAQLEGTENRISVARYNFNEATKKYNAFIRKFPQVFVAKMFGFEKKEYFKADEGASEVPKVSFE